MCWDLVIVVIEALVATKMSARSAIAVNFIVDIVFVLFIKNF